MFSSNSSIWMHTIVCKEILCSNQLPTKCRNYTCSLTHPLRAAQNWHSTYAIESAERSQRGDPLNSLEFCEAVHPTLSGGSARTKLGYVNDFNLEGKISTVALDFQRIIEMQAKTGLVFNLHKWEIIANSFDLIDQYAVFNQFKR